MAEPEKETVIVTNGERSGGGVATVAIVFLVLVVLVALFFMLDGTSMFSGGSTDIKATIDVNTPSGN